MRTIKKWLESIEDEVVRKKALEKLDPDVQDVEAPDLITALSCAFDYGPPYSEEEDYWSDVHFKILQNGKI